MNSRKRTSSTESFVLGGPIAMQFSTKISLIGFRSVPCLKILFNREKAEICGAR
jgi:hypothetical protein